MPTFLFFPIKILNIQIYLIIIKRRSKCTSYYLNIKYAKKKTHIYAYINEFHVCTTRYDHTQQNTFLIVIKIMMMILNNNYLLFFFTYIHEYKKNNNVTK